MKRKRNRSESNYVRRKINRWTRFLAKERDWDYKTISMNLALLFERSEFRAL